MKLRKIQPQTIEKNELSESSLFSTENFIELINDQHSFIFFL